MALKIPTVMTYPLTGAVDFAITFEYLARKFVTVTLIGKERKELVLNQDYRFTTKTQITTSRAWTSSDGYQMIEIRRFTSATERLVDFADGSILRAYDLNIAQIQTLHVAEEARDLTADTIGVNNDGHLDARGRRIVNVADGIELGDAITLGQVTRWNESALNSKNAAKVSENNSKDSENKAKASETNAKNSENLAHDWAQKAEDSPVAGSEYSAYHYSRKASASANASASSAAASLASQNAAKVSEDNAKVSETNAKASEVSAKDDADRAEREANKLGDMNDLASLIDSVDTAIPEVRWGNKMTLPVIPNLEDPENDSSSYAIRWESTKADAEFRNYSNQVDGGMMLVVKDKRVEGDPTPTYFVGDGTFNTRRIITRGYLDGKDPVTFPCLFHQALDVHFSANGIRLFSNGDLVKLTGQSVFERDFSPNTDSLGAVLRVLRDNAVADVWLSSQRWWGPLGGNNFRGDYALGGGEVMSGLTIDQAGGRAGMFIDGIFVRAIWIKAFNGAPRAILSQ